MRNIRKWMWMVSVILLLKPFGVVADEEGAKRQKLDYPEAEKRVFLANMRAHLETLAQIMVAISKGDHGMAADLASSQLGMESPGAVACKPQGSIAAPEQHPMSLMHHYLMPAPMKQLGRNMHQAADELAEIERQAQSKPDPAMENAALATLLNQCVSCHTRYRLN